MLFPEFKGIVSRIVDLTNANLDAISVGKSTWGKQIKEAMNVNGGDIEAATTTDYIMHFFTFGWKVGIGTFIFFFSIIKQQLLNILIDTVLTQEIAKFY